MKQVYYRVEDRQGLHVRPCVMIAKYLKEISSDSFIEWGDHMLKGTDKNGLVKWAVPKGELLLFTLRGEEEERDVEGLKQILNRIDERKYDERTERNMITYEHTITDPRGIHARPATLLADCFMRYNGTVHMICNDSFADGKNPMAIMNLGAKQGDIVSFCIDGTETTEILNKIKEILG